MNCIVTAGPTFEPLDEVRRLTNISTGRLGIDLGRFLTARGHEVTLLVGQQATWPGERRALQIDYFGTTSDLQARLQKFGGEPIDAVFHAAAVSDFAFGKVWQRSPQGELSELAAGKTSSRLGRLLAELVPTPKIIARLREWFPQACLVGWKYEVDGDRAGALAQAERQITECRTNACVANGPAYGKGFGLVTEPGQCQHLDDAKALFAALEALALAARG
jgi:phosphopantothenoylcysteine decarboxylase/phosphopantothenate--cysteine ligase